MNAGLDFDLFDKYGRQIKTYFSWPEELRKALPVLEQVKSQLNGRSAPEADEQPKRAKRHRRSKNRRSKFSGIRVDWTAPVSEGSKTTRRDELHKQFKDTANSYGYMPGAKVVELSKIHGCTRTAIRSQYSTWAAKHGFNGKRFK